MKVIHILDQVNRGGLETLELDVCRNARENNLDLIFITLGKGDLFDEFKNSGVEFYYFQRKYPVDFKIIKELRRVIKQNNVKIIHAHQDVTLVHAILSSLGTSAKVVQTIHGFSDKRSSKGAFDFKSYLVHLVGSYLVPATFAVTNYVRNELVKQGYNKRKLKVLYNGIDFGKFHKIQLNGNRDHWPFVFGMVGNFNHIRNHKVLLEAFAKLVAEGNGVYLKLAGKGELLEPMKEYASHLGISDRVEFMGSVSNLQEFFNDIDCFVYSSRSDTFGIAVVEAIYSGLPVVVSDNGPFREITLDGDLARLFKANDADSMYMCLKNIMEDRTIHVREDSDIKSKTRKLYSIERHINNLLEAYDSLLQPNL